MPRTKRRDRVVEIKFYNSLARLELWLANLQGRGWGSNTTESEVRAVRSLINPSDGLFVDVGGNIGNYTEALLTQFNSPRVVVFEPSTRNFEALTQRFSRLPNVVIEKLGLSNKAGEAKLFSDEIGSGLASLAKRRLDHFDIKFDVLEEIQTIKFEDYWNEKLQRQEIALCKLDVEGHELAVLQGFGEALAHVEIIQFEFGGANIDSRTFFQDFWYFFKNNGFELFRISPLGPHPIEAYSEADEFFVTTNYLARKKN